MFRKKWNFPHAVFLIDGKHVAIRKPAKSGSLFQNYKGFFSLVLMALVGGDYLFRWVNISGYGSMSDDQIFKESEFKKCLENEQLGFEKPYPLPHDDKRMPNFILGDDVFGIRTFLMKLYGHRELHRDERIYNY